MASLSYHNRIPACRLHVRGAEKINAFFSPCLATEDMATHVDVDRAMGQYQSSAARANKRRKRKRKAEQGVGESVSTAQDVAVTEGGPSKKVYT